MSYFVNLLAHVFRSLYSVEKRSSQEQLQDDFGDFPPAPLRCESLTGEFIIVRTSGIGQIYSDLTTQLRVIDSDIDSLSTDLKAKLGDELLDLQHLFQPLGPKGAKFVKRLIFGWLFISRTAKAIRYGATRPNVQGLFVPYSKNELQILVSSGRHGNKGDAHIVSHEHIHLLQHRNPENHSRHVREPQDLLSDDGWADSFLLYILEKKEVEARLHESVLSFYRAYHSLPTTTPGFLALLASSESIGGLVNNILATGGINFNRKTGKHSEREARPVEHLGWVLMAIKTPELQRRYITEVLPVMYGNLLRYYGDEVASRSFLNDISRPNYYDELYSSQTA